MPAALRSARAGLGRLAGPLPLSLLIAVIALAVRLVFIAQAASIPGVQTPAPGLDIDIYWQAARTLRHSAGDGLNLELMLCSAPLHAYWLALLQSLFGESLPACRLVTAVLAAARFPLVFGAAWRLTGSALASAVATLALALWPAAIYFDTVLLKASTDSTLISALVFCLLFPRPARTWSRAVRGLVAGVLCALCLLNQLNTALFVGPAALFLALEKGAGWRQRGAGLAPLLACVGLALGVVSQLGRNAGSQQFAPHSGFNLLVGFHPDAGISYRPVAHVPGYPYGHAFIARLWAEAQVERPLTAAEADRYYVARAVEHARVDPWRALRLGLARTGAALSSYETKGIAYVPYLARHASVLRLSPSSYGLLLVLGALGALRLARERRWAPLVLLLGLVAAIVASNAVSFVTFRLRAPAGIAWAVLAAPGVLAAGDLVRRRPAALAPRALGATVLVVALAGWLAIRVPFGRGHRAAAFATAEQGEVSAREARDSAARLATLDALAEPTLAQQAERAGYLARLHRHTDAYRAAREITEQTLASDLANLIYLRYLIWLAEYDRARAFVERVASKRGVLGTRAFEQLDNRWERAAYATFIAPRD